MKGKALDVVFDCAVPVDEASFSEFVKSHGLEWNPVKKGALGKTSTWAKFESNGEVEAMLGLLGADFNGNTLLVSRFDSDRHINLLPQVVQYLGDHFDDQSNYLDLSNLRDNKLKLNLNYFVDMQFCMFVIGVSARKHNIPIETLDISNNNVKDLKTCGTISRYIPGLRRLIVTGNPVEPSKVPSFQGLEVVGIDPPLQEAEMDEGTAEAMSHQLEWSTTRTKAPAPRTDFENPASDSRTDCLIPFIDYFVKVSDGNWTALSALYMSDACFSFLAGILRNEFSPWFRHVNNWAKKKEDRTAVGTDIVERQKALFPDGVKMEIRFKNFQIVSDLFFAVGLSGSLRFGEDQVPFVRSLVVVEVGGSLKISNDELSVRPGKPRS